ncbi:hypothetical protein NE237_015750 [Protea cynaroides]|uniref:Uncharacterized protein n=1 Tax=Protea cynaroides TaxID=273540 RepID=A0A9Q0KEM5_9MAGN|nr:hypothetical protein NE237_015750 [Protea cynaroides]
MDPKEKSPISSSPLSSPSSIPPPPPLESGLPVTQPVVLPSSSSPLMDFEDLPSARASSSLGVESKRGPFGESSILAGLSSTFSSASPSGEIGGFSAVKLSALMETESKGVFSGGGPTYLIADYASWMHTKKIHSGIIVIVFFWIMQFLLTTRY